ncbi:MAG: glycosyltransferase family 2 protein [Sphingobacteriales bacterium]|nr:glycosyltransferase family 2 protein [Sphingobacteriales bacterium]
MYWLKIFLLVSILLVFYTYAGYAVIAWVLTKLKGSPRPQTAADAPLIPVSLVIAAFNEAPCIGEKISNCLELDYPASALTLIFITDGSTDRTAEIIKEQPRIIHLHEDRREGKVAAIHRAMQFVSTPVVIFSDANTLLNKESIKKIVAHYHDPRTGGVAGEKRVRDLGNNEIAGAGEGLYWKYESLLKKIDSSFYSVVGAAGELFSVRTALYAHPGDDTILDDFIISLHVCRQGYKVAYEPGAYAIENPSASIKEEKKRKIRISAGAFQAMLRMKDLLNPFKYPALGFLYLSHRVFRWTLCPLLLPVIFFLNTWLLVQRPDTLVNTLFVMQLIFYTLAFTGWYLSSRKITFKPAYLAYYFVFINISLYQGFFRFLKGHQSVLWEKANRA